MSSNGMSETCACIQADAKPEEMESFNLLSAIPNQRIYRCGNCNAFLAYTEKTQEWEVLLQGDLETEIKTLYRPEPIDVTFE